MFQDILTCALSRRQVAYQMEPETSLFAVRNGSVCAEQNTFTL